MSDSFEANHPVESLKVINKSLEMMMEIERNRCVINSKFHSIADFPIGLKIIFEYLPGDDLISCLAVCRATNFEIADSDKLMDKILLNIPEGKVWQANYILGSTNRKYKHVAIHSAAEYLINFRNDYFQWTSLHIHRILFCPVLWKFLDQFRKTVCELIFSDNNVELLVDEYFPVFEKLTALKINCEVLESSVIFNEFQWYHSGLKDLKLS